MEKTSQKLLGRASGVRNTDDLCLHSTTESKIVRGVESRN